MSILGPLNAVFLKDFSSRQVARDVAYGPHERHRLDIYRPRKATGPLPCLFFVYGGAWDTGDRSEYSFAGRTMAALGFVTVIADYRLVPEVLYPAFLEDGMLALDWMRAEIGAYGGDPDRLVLMGHSAGAYNAVMLALDPAYLPRRSVKPTAVIGLSGPYDFYPFDVDVTVAAFGHLTEPERSQPVNLVTPDAPPMMLAHGMADTTVLPRNMTALAGKLSEAGVPVEMHRYEKATHPSTLLGLASPLRYFMPVYKDVARYLRPLAGDQPMRRTASR